MEFDEWLTQTREESASRIVEVNLSAVPLTPSCSSCPSWWNNSVPLREFYRFTLSF